MGQRGWINVASHSKMDASPGAGFETHIQQRTTDWLRLAADLHGFNSVFAVVARLYYNRPGFYRIDIHQRQHGTIGLEFFHQRADRVGQSRSPAYGVEVAETAVQTPDVAAEISTDCQVRE